MDSALLTGGLDASVLAGISETTGPEDSGDALFGDSGLAVALIE
jgi:hypothetical protein